jgi:hypothetical protein
MNAADPAGLDAAIEAARARVRAVISWEDEIFTQDETIRIAVRAAAPHLRAAALNEAADAYDPPDQWMVPLGRGEAGAFLRQRAERIGGGE